MRINEASFSEEEIIGNLLDLLRIHDRVSYNHTQIVASLAYDLAVEAERPEEECLRIYKGALLHDIGKLFVPSALLSRRTNDISPRQKELLVSHGKMGAEIIGSVKLDESYAAIAMQHNIGIGSKPPTSEDILNRNELVPFVSIADFVASNLDEGREYLRTMSSVEVVQSVNRKFGRGYFPDSLKNPFNSLMGKYGQLTFNTSIGSTRM
jgi:putative nucleotidyltransferase with HDIG domain